MSAKFGTSGLRGLVTELNSTLVANYTRAFLDTCDTGPALYIGRDLRASSGRIMADVLAAAVQAGKTCVDCGPLPTPALAFAAQEAGSGAIMITGSHIPADRNGLKFFTCHGEITKTDEVAICKNLGAVPVQQRAAGSTTRSDAAATAFLQRYLSAFGPKALGGRRIGLYTHSAVGRDLLAELLAGLGADVVQLGRSEHFIPVDTEAVDSETRVLLHSWVKEYRLDALVSTDGDSDRPLVVDETGQQVPGDILGQITAEYLQADTVVTPISSNSGVKQKGFDHVLLTRIGSPFVIAGMQAAGGRVVGYEANGGFLLGFEAAGPCAQIAPLRTRDCILPIVVSLVAATDMTLSARIAGEPAIVTTADRLQEVPVSLSQRLISTLSDDPSARADFLSALGAEEVGLDQTDGLRMYLATGGVLHLRPSGNAPELRIYTQAKARADAQHLLERANTHVGTAIDNMRRAEERDAQR